MGVLPQTVVGFLPRWYIFFFQNKHTSVDESQSNEIDMEWMKKILAIIKSLQISITVRKAQIIALQV